MAKNLKRLPTKIVLKVSKKGTPYQQKVHYNPDKELKKYDKPKKELDSQIAKSVEIFKSNFTLNKKTKGRKETDFNSYLEDILQMGINHFLPVKAENLNEVYGITNFPFADLILDRNFLVSVKSYQEEDLKYGYPINARRPAELLITNRRKDNTLVITELFKSENLKYDEDFVLLLDSESDKFDESILAKVLAGNVDGLKEFAERFFRMVLGYKVKDEINNENTRRGYAIIKSDRKLDSATTKLEFLEFKHNGKSLTDGEIDNIIKHINPDSFQKEVDWEKEQVNVSFKSGDVEFRLEIPFDADYDDNVIHLSVNKINQGKVIVKFDNEFEIYSTKSYGTRFKVFKESVLDSMRLKDFEKVLNDNVFGYKSEKEIGYHIADNLLKNTNSKFDKVLDNFKKNSGLSEKEQVEILSLALSQVLTEPNDLKSGAEVYGAILERFGYSKEAVQYAKQQILKNKELFQVLSEQKDSITEKLINAFTVDNVSRILDKLNEIESDKELMKLFAESEIGKFIVENFKSGKALVKSKKAVKYILTGDEKYAKKIPVLAKKLRELIVFTSNQNKFKNLDEYNKKLLSILFNVSPKYSDSISKLTSSLSENIANIEANYLLDTIVFNEKHQLETAKSFDEQIKLFKNHLQNLNVDFNELIKQVPYMNFLIENKNKIKNLHATANLMSSILALHKADNLNVSIGFLYENYYSNLEGIVDAFLHPDSPLANQKGISLVKDAIIDAVVNPDVINQKLEVLSKTYDSKFVKELKGIFLKELGISNMLFEQSNNKQILVQLKATQTDKFETNFAISAGILKRKFDEYLPKLFSKPLANELNKFINMPKSDLKEGIKDIVGKLNMVAYLPTLQKIILDTGKNKKVDINEHIEEQTIGIKPFITNHGVYISAKKVKDSKSGVIKFEKSVFENNPSNDMDVKLKIGAYKLDSSAKRQKEKLEEIQQRLRKYSDKLDKLAEDLVKLGFVSVYTSVSPDNLPYNVLDSNDAEFFSEVLYKKPKSIQFEFQLKDEQNKVYQSQSVKIQIRKKAKNFAQEVAQITAILNPLDSKKKSKSGIEINLNSSKILLKQILVSELYTLSVSSI